MKHLISIFLVFVISSLAMAQVETVTKNSATDELREDLKVPAGKTLTAQTGSTVNLTNATVALPADVSRLGPSIDLSSETTNTLPIAKGGTGATTAAGALTALGVEPRMSSELIARAPVNGPLWSGSQTVRAFCLPKPDGVSSLGPTTLPLGFIIDHDVPSSDPGSYQGLCMASPSGANGGARSFYIAQTNATSLEVCLYGSASGNYRTNLLSGYRSTYSGKRVKLLVKRTAAGISAKANGAALTLGTDGTAGTAPAWTEPIDLTRVDAGSLGTSGSPASGYNRTSVLLGELSSDEEANLFAGRPLPLWCYPALQGEVAAGVQKVTGDNSTFASDTSFWTKTNATISGGVGTFSVLYGTLVRNSLLKAGLIYAVRATTTGSVRVWGGSGSEAILTSGIWTLLKATGANLTIVGYSVGATVDDFEIVPAGIVAEQCRTGNVSAGELTWPDTVGGVWIMPSTGWIPAVRPAPTSQTVTGALNARTVGQALEINGGTISANFPAVGTGDFEVWCDWFFPSIPASDLSIVPTSTNNFRLYLLANTGRLQTGKAGISVNTASIGAVVPNRLNRIGYVRASGIGTYYINGVTVGTTIDTNDYTDPGVAFGGSAHSGNRVAGMRALNTTLTMLERIALFETGQLPARVYVPGGTTSLTLTGATASYISLSNISATGLTATKSVAGLGYVNFWPSSIPAIRKGNSCQVKFTVSGMNGNWYLANNAGNIRQLATGDMDITWACTSDTSGYCYFYSGDTTASVTISGFTGRTLGVTCEMDPRWNGVGLTVPDVSGAGRHFTIPETGVTPVIPASSTRSEVNLTISGTLSGGSSGLAIKAGGIDQNISLLPSGTGSVVVSQSSAASGVAAVIKNTATGTDTSSTAALSLQPSGISSVGVRLVAGKEDTFEYSGNRDTFLAIHTTLDGVEREVARFISSGSLNVGTGSSATAGELSLYTAASKRASIIADSSYLTIDSLTSNSLRLRTNSTTAVTIDSAQKVAFSRSISIGGGPYVTKILSNTATLDFPSINSGGYADLTITVTGAVASNAIIGGLPSNAPGGIVFNYIAGTDVITVRASNISTVAIDPPSGTYRATVVQH